MPFVCIAQIDVSQDADFLDGFYLVEADDGGDFVMETEDGPIACSPRDLTGSSLEVIVAPSASFSTIIAHFSGADISVDGPTNGHAVFAVSQARMALLPAGQWAFVMREKTAAGVFKDVMRGPFIIHPRPFP